MVFLNPTNIQLENFRDLKMGESHFLIRLLFTTYTIFPLLFFPSLPFDFPSPPFPSLPFISFQYTVKTTATLNSSLSFCNFDKTRPSVVCQRVDMVKLPFPGNTPGAPARSLYRIGIFYAISLVTSTFLSFPFPLWAVGKGMH